LRNRDEILFHEHTHQHPQRVFVELIGERADE
jgi:hypothetical protein